MQPVVKSNFISKSTAKYLNDFLRPIVETNPKGLLNVYLTEKALNTSSQSLNDDLISLIVKSIADEFGFRKEQVTLNRVNYQVLTAGQGLGYHSDANGAYEGTMDHQGYSALVYLTDDYEGGEILFYDDDSGSVESATSYHPDAGTLIYFRGDDDHPHSVNEVLSGERANLILFYDVKGDI